MNRYRHRICASALLAFSTLGSEPAVAQDGVTIHRFVLVRDLKLMCAPGGDAARLAQCSGYVLATVDGVNTANVVDGRPEIVCPPDGVGDAQLVRVVQDFLKSGKAPDDNFGASGAILQALAKEYPCK
jgi:hypothetical protein